MGEKHVVKFHHIAHFFRDSPRHLARGENAYASSHVQKFLFDASVKPCFIKADVKPSMKKQNYQVEIGYNLNEGIVQAFCTCPRGQLCCHHMAACMYHAHYHVSSTDVACVLNAPRTNVEAESAVKLKDIHVPKKTKYKATQRLPNEEETAQFLKNIGYSNCVGFSWLLRPEPTAEALVFINDIEDLINSPQYITAPDKEAFISEKCSLSNADILKIEVLTRQQFYNPNWHVARKHRLTASKFGIVLKACQRNKFPPSLFKNLMEGYSLERVAAVQWGRMNEKTAIKELEAAMNFKVQETGLWLDSSGFLGASPDGILVDHDTVVEVKCPYKYRDAENLKDSLKDKNYFAFYDEDGEFNINAGHNFYHQIQGQIYLTGRSRCYFVIWTPKSTQIFPVEKDENWANNLNILKDFYLQKYIPHILK